jgi:glyoxylase-like metal-dependent hydrolase (beta-lactamase superfamily II)
VLSRYLVERSLGTREKYVSKPVEVDIIIKDEFNLSDYGVDGRILHTSGHTEGSVSIIYRRKVLFNRRCVI